MTIAFLDVAITIEYVSTAISLVCLPINILFVYILIIERNRPPYNTPFFRLCIHLSIADILMEVFSTLFFKFPSFGVFPDNFYKENWSVVPIAGMQYLGHAQAFGIIFIAVNRFTAVHYPIKHRQQWWTPKVTKTLLLIQWITPIFFMAPLFFTDFKFLFSRNSGSVIFAASDARFHKNYFLAMAIVDGIVINSIVLLLYGAIFVRVHTHVVVRKPGELALRLALSAFIIFICYLALGVCSLLSALTPPPDAWVYRTMWFVVNDVLCNSSALVLLALNRPIRKAFTRHLGIFSYQGVSTKNNSLLQAV